MTETCLFQALLGHTDAVTCLTASSTYHIVVSGSRDRTCIIWDLNKLSFVTQLRGHRAPVSALCINELTVSFMQQPYSKNRSTVYTHRLINCFILILKPLLYREISCPVLERTSTYGALTATPSRVPTRSPGAASKSCAAVCLR